MISKKNTYNPYPVYDDDYAQKKGYNCYDGMCGAVDCDTCYPWGRADYEIEQDKDRKLTGEDE